MNLYDIILAGKINGSGGGNGDFSTFTMTLVTNEMLSMTLPQIFEAGEMGPGAPAAVASLDASWGAGEYKIAAYKGASVFTVNGGANKHIAVSGGVTYIEEAGANGTLTFTGDGTVTYS